MLVIPVLGDGSRESLASSPSLIDPTSESLSQGEPVHLPPTKNEIKREMRERKRETGREKERLQSLWSNST